MASQVPDPVRSAGRLIVAGFAGLEPGPEFLRALAAGEFGGIIVFTRNYENPGQMARLIADLQSRAPWPLLVAIDQEGGKVQRFRDPFTVLPEMAALGERNDADLAYRVGRLLAVELAAIGINWNLAPVLDVHTNPANPVIGRRAFGDDPALVARMGVALARGLEDAGVLSCGKHFPGHGDTAQDSHHTLPVLPHSLERLRRVELAPFEAYARAGLGAVMTAHVLFPGLDPVYPATLSRPVLSLLRDELHFGGLIVSDDLDMKAVADRYGSEEMIDLGIDAGIDVFLACLDLDRARRASERLRALAAGAKADAIARSLSRVQACCARFAAPRPDAENALQVLGCEAHRRIASEISG
jgi:beta-N-acetylhexosaminidase